MNKVHYIINGKTFSTKPHLLNYTRAILNGTLHRNGKDFIFALLTSDEEIFNKKHGTEVRDIGIGRSEYTKDGVKQFGTKCFILKLQNGTTIDFSMTKSIHGIKPGNYSAKLPE